MRLQPARPSKRRGLRRPRRGTPRLFAAAVATLAAWAAASPSAAWAAAPAPVLVWSSASPAGSPPPMAYASAAYDADNSTVVLFGGVASNGSLSDQTWIWDGSSWTEAEPAHAPPAREMAAMAFDPTLHQLILFGGQGANGTLLDDTWAWNGASWIQLAAQGPNPSAREAAAFAYAPNGNLLLFGGTGVAESAAPASGSTLPGAGAAPAAAASQTVLGDTWQWTSAGWVRSSVSGPPARSGAVLAYDGSGGSGGTQGTSVLFGGESTPASATASKPLGDTWVWSGSAWQAAKPATSPPARLDAAADLDGALGAPLLLCGETASGPADDAWLWSGSSWTQARVEGSPTPRQGAAAAYDSAAQEMVMFGGSGPGGATLGDTVLVKLPPTPTPATVPGSTTTTTTAPNTPTGSGPVPSGQRETTTSRPSSPTTQRATLQPSRPTSTRPAPVAAPAPLSLETNLHQVRSGGTVLLTGSGFAPGSVVSLSFHSADPSPLGDVTVGENGTFSKLIVVPTRAAPGRHQIVATGRAITGASADLAAAVMVVTTHHHGLSSRTTLALLGLAILIPVAAYLGMAGAGLWRRRRQAGGPGTA
jgi:hypothetical protein